MSPRMILWLRSRGEDPSTFVSRDADGNVSKVDDEGEALLWTVVYSRWIMARWSEWASWLGYRRSTFGSEADTALRAGHTVDEFDAWLKTKY